MESYPDSAVKGAAAEALINAACQVANKQTIVEAGGIQALLHCISPPAATAEEAAVSNGTGAREAAASAIGCLTFFFEPAQACLLEAGGIPILLSCLTAASPAAGVSATQSQSNGWPSEAALMVCGPCEPSVADLALAAADALSNVCVSASCAKAVTQVGMDLFVSSLRLCVTFQCVTGGRRSGSHAAAVSIVAAR